ncbi:uncharacterized protein LOC126802545 [Argentina anserina]|uniref:uncharacterized protein LOC126802545 n=1 Tax=Argentina anserina TaxID=57926 RepID=UPI0021762B95|nr:uncharacterized protein LOC126802545 [Potentilla anserina]
MDFHTLTRKALQALCKHNGIPANITNVAVADSLSALPHVEGLEELMNQSPEKIMIGSASVFRTAARTTTSCSATKKTIGEEVDKEKAEVPSKTPAAPSTRRRVATASARQTTETVVDTTSVQCGISTRRSVRLLGKTMSKMSLDKDNTMASSIHEHSADTMDCSKQSESSVVKGSDMQTVSEGSSNGIDASEVLSEINSNGQVVDETLVKVNKMDVTEVQEEGPMQGSRTESEEPTLKAASDVIMISEVMDESCEESSANKEPRNEGAHDAVVGKESDGVITTPSVLPQVNEPPTTVNSVELISSILNSTPTKSLANKTSYVNVASTIPEPKEAPKTEALASSELQDNMNNISEASEEEASDDESTGGESSEEKDSNDDITEEESSEDESEKQSVQNSLIVETAKAEVTQTSSPLPVNLPTQFPRPTSAKSSGKKRPETAVYFSDDNEESLDTSTEMDKDEDLEEVEMKKDHVAKENVKEFEAKSLRELKKLLKSQLNIGDSKDTKVVDKGRVALSEVPENQMVVKEN